MNKDEFHDFLADPATGPLLDHMLADNAKVDAALDALAAERIRERRDDLFRRYVRRVCQEGTK